MELRRIDGLSWANDRVEQFFPIGRIDAIVLLAYIMTDVIELGQGECHISSKDGWWFVSSDVDWLQHPSLSINELFANVVPAPAHGLHSLRAEVLVNAFATDVFIWSHECKTIIKGESPNLEVVDTVAEWAQCRRILAFRVV
jgi:hypothetical protein